MPSFQWTPEKAGWQALGHGSPHLAQGSFLSCVLGQSSLSLGMRVCIMGRVVRRRLCKMAGSLCRAGAVCTLCSWRGITCRATISQHCCSVAQSCPTLCNPADCSTAGLPVLHQLPASAQTHVHRVGDAAQPSHPVSPLPLPSHSPSIRLFSIELALRIRWPVYWSVSFSVSPSSDYSGLISFRMDWFDLAVQGTPDVGSSSRSLAWSLPTAWLTGPCMPAALLAADLAIRLPA